MASIHVELETIKNDPDGQDVLNAIASASEEINQNEYDITEELEIIRNPMNRYGIDIRMAIHDALQKLNDKESGGGGDEGGFIVTSDVQAVSDGDIADVISGNEQAVSTGAVEDLIFGFVIRVPENKWGYWQEENDNSKTSATLDVTLQAPCLLLACVMYRGDSVSIQGDGWTKVVDGVQAYNDDHTIYQKITIWKKQASAGPQTVTVTQSSSARMSLKTLAIYEASSVSVIDNALFPASGSFTPTATTGNRRLYVISSIHGYSSGESIVGASQETGQDLQSAKEARFYVWYDYQPELLKTPTFTHLSEYPENTDNVVTLDIIEEVS